MYDVPDTEEYSWGQDQTFGATTVTHQIVGPRGKVGFVRDLMCDVTTSLVGTTAVPEIDVGISSGDSTFGRYRLGTAAGTGLGTGFHRASTEAITGNPPRTLADFSGHVVLDGGPFTSAVLAGGSSTTVMPQGRIPASPFTINNVVSGTGSVVRAYVNEEIPPQLIVGQTVNVRGIQGATGAAGQLTISAIDPSSNPKYVEFSGTTFGGAYTGGGQFDIVVFVTLKQGSGGSPAGGGYARVKIAWLGPVTP